MKKTLLLLFLTAIFLPTKILGQEMNSAMFLPFNYDSTNYNSSDYSFLKKVVGNKRIVLLGEPTHGEGNIFSIKINIIKYLVEQMGFKVIAFESNIYDLYKFNTSHDLTKQDIASSIYPIWTGSKEFSPFIDWSYKNKDKIILAGFDNQLPNDSKLLNNFFDDIDIYMDNMSDEDADFFTMSLEYISKYYSVYKNFDFLKFNSITNNLVTEIKKDKTDNLFLIQTLNSITSLVSDYYYNDPNSFTKETFKAKFSNPRDRQMALNLIFLYNYYKQEKIICWGASLHFSNDFNAVMSKELQEYIPMGKVLKDSIGNDIVNIGVTTSKGFYLNYVDKLTEVPSCKPNSIENILSEKSDYGMLFAKDINDTITFSNLIDYTPFSGVFNKVFDYVLYVKEVSPPHYFTNTIIESHKDSSEQVNNSNENIIKYKFEIFDSKTKLPVQYASISLQNNLFTGTITNEKGYAELIINDKIVANDTLIVSCIGYLKKKIVLDKNMLNKNIFLDQENIMLKEVIISAKPITALSIMKKAVKKMKTNYNTNSYSLEFFKREIDTYNNDTTLYIELVKSAYYDKSEISKKNDNYTETVIEANPIKHNEAQENFYGIAISTYLNMNILFTDIGLFQEKNLKKYILKIDTGKSTDSIYVIDIVSKRNSHKYTALYYCSSFSGNIYINKSDNAILKIICSYDRDTSILNNQTRKYYKTGRFNHLYKQETINNVFIFEKNIDDKYYVKYGSIETKSEGVSYKERKPFQFESYTEIFTSKIITQNPVKPKNIIYDFEYNKFKYNKAFWLQYNKPVMNSN